STLVPYTTLFRSGAAPGAGARSGAAPSDSAPATRGRPTRMLLTRPILDPVDLLALQRQAPVRYRLLLESSAHGTAQGRWDLLLVADGDELRLGHDGLTRDRHDTPVEGSFLDALD